MDFLHLCFWCDLISGPDLFLIVQKARVDLSINNGVFEHFDDLIGVLLLLGLLILLNPLSGELDSFLEIALIDQ